MLKTKIRIPAMIAAILMVGSCSPPLGIVFAVMEKDQLVFHVREGGMFRTLFGWDDERFLVDRFEVYSKEKLYWRVRPTDTAGDQLDGAATRSASCKDSTVMPVTYLEQRCHWQQDVRQNLDVGRVYAVSLDGAEGAFRLDAGGAVTNMEFVNFEAPGGQRAK
ncbi:hypothetical protein ACFOWX_09390 [Sphingorhabdus arenilitoris]|uniref:Lipoprotein n=1 Tax=Sphingorhabdus arenilitoris TaxID=1490041 RepID=A0ABV8RGW4_9SPHN